MITVFDREKLHQFFAAHFHEDWSEEGRTAEQIIDAYMRSQSDLSEAKKIAQLITILVREYPDDRQLENILFKELGCYYSPAAIGQSSSLWLTKIAERLAKVDRAG